MNEKTWNEATPRERVKWLRKSSDWFLPYFPETEEMSWEEAKALLRNGAERSLAAMQSGILDAMKAGFKAEDLPGWEHTKEAMKRQEKTILDYQ